MNTWPRFFPCVYVGLCRYGPWDGLIPHPSPAKYVCEREPKPGKKNGRLLTSPVCHAMQEVGLKRFRADLRITQNRVYWFGIDSVSYDCKLVSISYTCGFFVGDSEPRKTPDFMDFGSAIQASRRCNVQYLLTEQHVPYDVHGHTTFPARSDCIVINFLL
jgi:hypothetical protein